jgi:DNA modification methylase
MLNIEPEEPPADPGAQIDKADELREAWQTERGQLWVVPSKSVPGKEHRLLCGDSTSEADVARLMGGEKAGLMNTDPPYGVDYAAVKNGIPRSGFKNIQKERGDIENDNLTDGPQLQAFLESAIRAAVPHLVENPAFYLWHPMLTQGTFFAAAAAAAAADILIHRQIIWVKPHMVLTRSGMYHWKHELCFYGWIRGKKCAWLGDKSQTSVWEMGENTRDRNHPTQKPVELFTRPMKNHLEKGEIAYEPFSGSGSQFVAAEQLGRLCYGIEICEKYVAVALQRLADMGLEPRRSEAVNG